jgi:hypothetical protein
MLKCSPLRCTSSDGEHGWDNLAARIMDVPVVTNERRLDNARECIEVSVDAPMCERDTFIA